MSSRRSSVVFCLTVVSMSLAIRLQKYRHIEVSASLDYYLGPTASEVHQLYSRTSHPHLISNDQYSDICKADKVEDIALGKEDMRLIRRGLREHSGHRETNKHRARRRTRRSDLIRSRRAATALPERLWPEAVIPYEIEANFTSDQKGLFKLAMRHWENYTCVVFIERNPSVHSDYILFTRRECGCCSFVGRKTGQQTVSIAKNCDKFGIVVHELGHAIGFWHEHTRPDRDEYVDINLENVAADQRYNFNKLTAKEVNSLGEAYDYESIMHYKLNTFAKTSDLYTIETKNWDGRMEFAKGVGQRERLSSGDIRQTHKLYNCPACGQTLQEVQGKISAPLADSLQQSPLCQWRISATHGEKILLNMTSTDLPPCEHGKLTIIDGYYSESPLIGVYCGDKKPEPLLQSSDNRLWLELRINSSPQQQQPNVPWFTASYEAICGGTIEKNRGVLQSPNFPGDYRPNEECVWNIKVKEGYSVALIFHTFDIEKHDDCVYDYLEVRDGDGSQAPLIGRRFCGQDLPRNIKSTGNSIYMKFVTDGSVFKSGFSAEFVEEYDECASPDHGCQQNCVNTMGSYKCECYLGYQLRSDGRNCEEACGGYIEAHHGVLNSPSFPDHYPQSKSCVWQLVAPESYHITLDFTHFDLEGDNSDCEYDYVEVYNGVLRRPEDRIKTFCGTTMPDPITSEDNVLRIAFNSDSSIQKSGFSLVYFTDKDECRDNNGGCDHNCINEIGSYSCSCREGYALQQNKHSCKEGDCSHKITSVSGEIQSPGFPEDYRPNMDCTWLLKAAPGHRIKLKFKEFNVESHESCSFDNLKVYDATNKSHALGTFCRHAIPPDLESSARDMFIVFKSDTSVERKGFSIEHSMVCGGRLVATEEAQIVHSHPTIGGSNYPNDLDCEWNIENPRSDHVINIEFDLFNIEDETKCSYDYLHLFHGQFEADNLMDIPHCGKNVTIEPLFTDSAKVRVVFKTDVTINEKGFIFRYRIVPKNEDDD